MLAVRRFIKLHPETQSMLEAITGQDLNGDGVLQYVMVVGDPENVDAKYRTEFSISQYQEVSG